MTQTPTAPLHVVLGAGQIGSRLTQHLLAGNHRVRMVRHRAGLPSTHPLLDVVHGDMTDLTFAERATENAKVVYDCMNPPYYQWPKFLLALGRGGLHGAAKARAKLVAIDSLYMYGKATGPMSETTPVAPCSKKGELRAELGRIRLEAHRRGDVQVALGRASDFFGADLQFSMWNDRFFQRLFAGKAGECMGDPEMPHAYTYADDVAKALALLGEADDATGVWHLPTAPAESTRNLAQRLGRALGIKGDSKRMPRWLMAGVGVFSPFMRELLEMTYQWERPFLVDDSKFVKRFGVGATPFDVSVPATAAWASKRFRPAPQQATTRDLARND